MICLRRCAMTANTNAITTQLKHNPDFLSKVTESMGDALCLLLLETEIDNNFEKQNIIIQLARTRLDVCKLYDE